MNVTVNTHKMCILFQANDVSVDINTVPYESVLKIKGTVMRRPEDQCNKKMKTGDIEVQVTSLEILNLSKSQLPFSIRNFQKAKESLQMQYRYLALRFPELQRNLRIRSWVTMKMREYLIDQCAFCEIVTPTLFCKTPGVGELYDLSVICIYVYTYTINKFLGCTRVCCANKTRRQVLFSSSKSTTI